MGDHAYEGAQMRSDNDLLRTAEARVRDMEDSATGMKIVAWFLGDGPKGKVN